MREHAEMFERCAQCGFDHARIDTEGWDNCSTRRVMCPVCGWTKFEEHLWEDNTSRLVKRNESYGFGAFRLVPPGGFAGYNAFHSVPSETVLNDIKTLLTTKGWKGYLSIWDSAVGKARLIAGCPLQKYEVMKA